ncbi:alpha-1,2-glucosyltransferase [Alternaria panax]|uniref:Dol-P-Glc:Glc(2)Man(9)GlcNAc(2)-PP-Dol alpha-1,2-glucosyltransferase n=1 Tax=Alternaria panax TaxID=48097 RepID=A0AAD4FIS1_9PLEO|nr:alpha-1,2-glucosyltransferase [Alternaria panax]
MRPLLEVWALPSAIAFLVSVTVAWYREALRQVPNPYLDEYFHIPQAQKYCKGDYSWDPKITTPPGLYLISKLLMPLLGCETSSLRMLNAGALCIIMIMSYGILRLLRKRDDPGKSLRENEGIARRHLPVRDTTLVVDVHSALNTALFPPLFFFSALYYTDVMSTLVVLFAYSAYLTTSISSRAIVGSTSTVALGVFALLLRQTNIFWVAVFPAGLAVIDALKKDASSTVPRSSDVMSAVQTSWNYGAIYDCCVQDAALQDVVIFVLSLVVAALRKPLIVLKVALPYVALLVLFAGFVVWNGSVVLGDKSAHTATIHLPQMLYIWPYVAFFSAPLVIGPLLRPVVSFLPKRVQTMCHEHFNTSYYGLPMLATIGLFIASSFLAVHFNTIIHPYTLADNRHYVFYVFKMLRLYPALKYLAVPVYYVCAWATVQALASPPRTVFPNKKHTSQGKSNPSLPKDRADRQPCQISFVIVWLVTTALSLVTAPLVEPRYFIIPWIIWRLHIPYSQAALSNNKGYDVRMMFETVWLLAINAAVSYTFLYRTFTWPSEPGNIQRFIW